MSGTDVQDVQIRIWRRCVACESFKAQVFPVQIGSNLKTVVEEQHNVWHVNTQHLEAHADLTQTALSSRQKARLLHAPTSAPNLASRTRTKNQSDTPLGTQTTEELLSPFL
eukprot:1367314-Rhodomonas_salina.4